MNNTALILGLFPGQGSQKVGMGKELFEKTDIAKKFFAMADEVLGFSLSNLCFEGPDVKLTATEYAQPAILTISTICYELFKEQGLSLAVAAGHSLGEYSALVAAGAIKFEDAVKLVHNRGRYMQEAVPVGLGKMVAVLGKEVEEIELACSSVKTGLAAIANVNGPGQVVLAGDKEAIDAAVANLGNAKVIEIPVSAPFHCELMKPAQIRLSADLDALTISKANFPVYANFTAAAETEPKEIRENLKKQVCGRVRWVECMTHAISEQTPTCTVEFGQGNILSNLLKRITPSVKRFSVDSVGATQALKLSL